MQLFSCLSQPCIHSRPRRHEACEHCRWLCRRSQKQQRRALTKTAGSMCALQMLRMTHRASLALLLRHLRHDLAHQATCMRKALRVLTHVCIHTCMSLMCASERGQVKRRRKRSHRACCRICSLHVTTAVLRECGAPDLPHRFTLQGTGTGNAGLRRRGVRHRWRRRVAV